MSFFPHFLEALCYIDSLFDHGERNWTLMIGKRNMYYFNHFILIHRNPKGTTTHWWDSFKVIRRACAVTVFPCQEINTRRRYALQGNFRAKMSAQFDAFLSVVTNRFRLKFGSYFFKWCRAWSRVGQCWVKQAEFGQVHKRNSAYDFQVNRAPISIAPIALFGIPVFEFSMRYPLIDINF